MSQAQQEVLLMAVRGIGEGSEAEAVIVRAEGGRVVLELDDGDRLAFDKVELVTALVDLGQVLAA